MSTQPSRRPARTPSTVAPSAASTPVAATRTTARSRLAAASVLRSPTHDQGAFDLFAAYEALLADLADLDSARAADASKLREQFRALTTSAANAREQLDSPAGGLQDALKAASAGLLAQRQQHHTAGAALDGEAAALEADLGALWKRLTEPTPQSTPARPQSARATPLATPARSDASRPSTARSAKQKPGGADAEDATPPSPSPEEEARAARREAAARAKAEERAAQVEAWRQRKMREKAEAEAARAEAEKAAAAKKAAAARRADDVKLQLAARALERQAEMEAVRLLEERRQRERDAASSHQRALALTTLQQRDAAHVERRRRALEAKAEPTRARELRQQELAESVRAARPATPRDESRVLQPTTASASRLIDPEQKFEVKPQQRGRPDAALNPGRRAIPAWRAPLHK